MKTVRILIYEGTRNTVERSIQYRNIKGRTTLTNALTMDEHLVPDTHVVVEIDRADVKALEAIIEGALDGKVLSGTEHDTLVRIYNGVYGGDVRV